MQDESCSVAQPCHDDELQGESNSISNQKWILEEYANMNGLTGFVHFTDDGISGAVAYSMGYINEKYADGSIIPGWIIHALSNVFSGICSAFMLI